MIRQTPNLYDVIVAVLDEIEAQNTKWGVQNHPMHGGYHAGNREYYSDHATLWREVVEGRAKHGTTGWDGILLEEAFEACAAETTDQQIEELVQVAAVAVNAILSLHRRQNDDEGGSE